VMAARVLVQQEAEVGRGPVGGRDRQQHAGIPCDFTSRPHPPAKANSW
jgi:hypothetical protein